MLLFSTSVSLPFILERDAISSQNIPDWTQSYKYQVQRSCNHSYNEYSFFLNIQRRPHSLTSTLLRCSFGWRNLKVEAEEFHVGHKHASDHQRKIAIEHISRGCRVVNQPVAAGVPLATGCSPGSFESSPTPPSKVRTGEPRVACPLTAGRRHNHRSQREVPL